MNIDIENYLDLVESTDKICFFDLESTGFKGDYNSIIVGSITPFNSNKSNSFCISQLGNDKKIVREIKAELEKYLCWVTYYGKGFDIPMMNTRLLKWGYPPVEARHHLDLYYGLKPKLNTSRKSLGHLVSWLNLPDQESKMGVSPDVWNQLNVNFSKHMKTLKDRCESDTRILKELYLKTKHLIKEIKK